MRIRVLIPLIACVACASSGEAPRPPPLEADAIVVETRGAGRLAWRFLYQSDRSDQRVALWIPDGVETVRGVILSLHRASEAERTDLHAVAKALGFAVYGVLTRWVGFEELLPAQLAELATALGHAEVANVPWTCIGGSRNVGALARLTALIPDRILCLLACGGPGKPPGVDRPALWQGIPVMTVNGSIDPFVGGMDWLQTLYWNARQAGLPQGGCVEWGTGHAPVQNGRMYWPFVQAVHRHRVPADADPRQGPVRLKPFTEDQGWLIADCDFAQRWGGEARPFAEFTGDKARAVWLPDAASVAVWRAMSSADAATVTVTGSGALTLGIAGLDAPPERVEWFAGDRSLGVATAVPFTLITPVLASGLHSVFAECRIGAVLRRTQPVIVADGRVIDQRAGHRAARLADTASGLLLLTTDERAALSALEARRGAGGATQWKEVLRDSVDGALAAHWYLYEPGNRKGPAPRLETKDGEIELSANENQQATVMLRFDWPEDVAFTYRAKALGEKVCDLSAVVSGHENRGAFPWRDGLMFQFGAHFNQGSFWLVHEQPHKDWKPFDCGARATPGTWQTVRVERLDNVLTAAIDGTMVAKRVITDEEAIGLVNRRLGIYTFSSTIRIDDVAVSIRAPLAGAAPAPLPPASQLATLAVGLARGLAHRNSDQRRAAELLLRTHLRHLAPALGALRDQGALPTTVTDRLPEWLAALPPE